MLNRKKIALYKIGLVIVLFSSCTKNFQTINTTPGLPSDISIGPLINGALSTLFLRGQEQVSVHNDWYYPVTQLAATSGNSGYILANGAQDIWNDYYSTLQDLNLALDKINASKGEKQDLQNIQAIVYILRAYKTFRVTDQFGDIPYFEAGQAYTGDAARYRPKFDAQQLIYDSLLTDLKWAVTNITTTSPLSISSSETLFGGNMNKWLAFANSLRLRYAMQMVEKDPSKATPIIADALNGSYPLITDGADVGMSPTLLPNTSAGDALWVRPWSFSSHKFMRISSTFWYMVADGTSTASIFDPRALIFAETNQAGNWAPYVIGSNSPDNANPYNTSVRDVTINNKDNSLFSSFNYYLIRDQYYIPEFIMNSAEVHFLKAEAYERGLGVTQNPATAQAEYIAGI
ncbi:MAG TPA: SusD/RagB family nutrient-binding outer membrane lipoprotein, partial [Puia sp.]|nr:SusD/RagB family nutrient-binding outer membrane lipoprotein [Puia sp.]